MSYPQPSQWLRTPLRRRVSQRVIAGHKVQQRGQDGREIVKRAGNEGKTLAGWGTKDNHAQPSPWDRIVQAPAANLIAPTLALRLFGPFEARLNGAPLPRLRTRKGYRLLALLALRHGREVERAWLAEMLWPDSPAARVAASL